MVTGATDGPVLDALVLAAGAGARFGGGKLTASWRGGALIDGALGAAAAAPVRSVVVVTGYDPRVALAVEAWTAAHRPRVAPRTVRARDAEKGMSASLAAGLAALPPGGDGVFIFLGDMPLIPARTPPALAQALAAGAWAAAPTHAGRRGHPVLVSVRLYPALMKLEGDAGARDILAGLGFRLALVKASGPGVLVDVDAPDDLKALG